VRIGDTVTARVGVLEVMRKRRVRLATTCRNQHGEAVLELMRELHRGGATICMVTHDPRYAQHADRIVHLFDGLIVEEEAGANRREIEDAKRELKESGFGAIA